MPTRTGAPLSLDGFFPPSFSGGGGFPESVVGEFPESIPGVFPPASGLAGAAPELHAATKAMSETGERKEWLRMRGTVHDALARDPGA